MKRKKKNDIEMREEVNGENVGKWFGVSLRQRIIKALYIITAAILSMVLMSSCVPPNVQLSPVLEAYRQSMIHIPLPKKGCFQSSYPNLKWKEVQCGIVRPYPQPPRQGPRPLIVGNGNDVSVKVLTGFISTAIGSFDSVAVTSESGQINNTGPSVANAYTLQLNTNPFASTACAGSPNPACLGWEQFVYENDGSAGYAYIQYWLIQYNTTCPAGWHPYLVASSTDIDCFRNNNLGPANVPNQPITNLGKLSLSGTVGTGSDSIIVSTGINIYSVVGDNAVNAAAGWQVAEFNVFGDAGGGQANFNSGSTIIPRTRVINGDSASSVCVAEGFTAETNNLSFGSSAPTASSPGPAVEFTESSAGGLPSNCAAATTVDDTQLTFFNGLF